MLVEGKVAFSNITEFEEYRGQSTEQYSLVVQLDEEQASVLQKAGVKLKDYEGTPQRRFRSKFPVRVVAGDDSTYRGEVPRGSIVRVSFKTGDEHPVHGVSTYLNAIRVLEEGEASAAVDEGF